MTLSPAERQRYRRHLSLQDIGAKGQEKLKAARVLVVGAGGLGSPAALYLAAAGIGTLGIADGDRLELSNLHRQVLFTTADIGAQKALAAQAHLRALNPDIQIAAHPLRLNAHNILEIIGGYDVVLDGSDRLSTRYLLNDACVIAGKPFVSAAIHRFEGQALTYAPKRGPCYRCLFPAASDDLIPNCAEAGVLGVLPGVLGTLQATEAIKLILGIGANLIGRLLTYDALALKFDEFTFRRRADCAVCGDAPTILAPRDATPGDAMPGEAAPGVPTTGDAAPGDVPSGEAAPIVGLRPLGAPDLATLLNAAGARIAVIDVREPREFAAGHLPNALNLPLGELPQRLNEIPRDALPVFVCRSGSRSLRACRIAARANIAPIAHLEGGLSAWTDLIDPDFEVA